MLTWINSTGQNAYILYYEIVAKIGIHDNNYQARRNANKEQQNICILHELASTKLAIDPAKGCQYNRHHRPNDPLNNSKPGLDEMLFEGLRHRCSADSKRYTIIRSCFFSSEKFALFRSSPFIVVSSHTNNFFSSSLLSFSHPTAIDVLT